MDVAFYRSLYNKALKRIKRIKAASHIKSRFISKLSYELRTPLTSILGRAQLLSMDSLPPHQQKCVSDILTAGEHMLSLIDELLDTSFLETGKVGLKKENFNLKVLLNVVMEMVSFHAQAKGLQVVLDYEDNVPTSIIGDMRLLRQIVVSLFNRAIKHTAQGSIIMQVACLSRSEQFVEIALQVKDTGKVMSEEALATLKDYLAPHISHSLHRYGSIDTGLLIAIDYLKRMKAHVSVESTAPIGTTISCKIPFQLPNSTSAVVQENPAQALVTVSKLDRKLRILLVEDDEIIQTVHRIILHKMQIDVDVAHNSKTALAYYAQHQYDLIFMDIGLPDRDGLETTRHIRQLAAGKQHTPIIALTAHGQKEDTQSFLEAGIDEVLIKPVNMVDFVRLIKTWSSSIES